MDAGLFPDIVPVSALKNVSTGANYLVGEIKTTPKGYNYLQPRELVGKFVGLNSFLDYQRTFQKTPRREGASNAKIDNGFTHFNSYKDAFDTYLHDPKSVQDFTEHDVSLNGGDSAGTQVEFDHQGDYIDIARFLEGEPECFGFLTDGNPRGLRVNIVINLSWSAYVDKAVINARNNRLLRLVDWLENQQIRTSVLAIESTEVAHIELLLKQFDEPLDLNDLAIVGHSDFLRRICFRFDEYSKTWRGGYGSSREFSYSYDAALWQSDYTNEYTVFTDSRQDDETRLNRDFNDLEAQLASSIESGDEASVLDILT